MKREAHSVERPLKHGLRGGGGEIFLWFAERSLYLYLSLSTASRCNLAQLGHKNLIFAFLKCSFVDFFLLKYELTQAQVMKVFY